MNRKQIDEIKQAREERKQQEKEYWMKIAEGGDYKRGDRQRIAQLVADSLTREEFLAFYAINDNEPEGIWDDLSEIAASLAPELFGDDVYAKQDWPDDAEIEITMPDFEAWAIGDLLKEADRSGGVKLQNEIKIESGFDSTELDKVAEICTLVPHEIRREDLSFKHHAAVARLRTADMKRFLDLAASRQWTVEQLKEQVSLFMNPPDCKHEIANDADVCAECGQLLTDRTSEDEE